LLRRCATRNDVEGWFLGGIGYQNGGVQTPFLILEKRQNETQQNQYISEKWGILSDLSVV